MANCDAAMDILKDKIIKKVTKKDVMKIKLDQEKIPFKITVDNIKKNIKNIKKKDFLYALKQFIKIQTKIKDIEKKDFLYALKQFIKIKQKSKGGSRSRKGGHWVSWVVYILCRVAEEHSGETRGINPAITRWLSECEDDFAAMEEGFNTDYGSPAASAASPAASSSAASSSAAASASPAAAVTYTADSIRRMTMADLQSIPSDIVDSWNGDYRYDAYTWKLLDGGGKKTYRKRKTKKRKKSRKRKSRKKRRKRKTKRKRSSRKRR